VPVLDTIGAEERPPHAMILVSTCRRGCRSLGDPVARCQGRASGTSTPDDSGPWRAACTRHQDRGTAGIARTAVTLRCAPELTMARIDPLMKFATPARRHRRSDAADSGSARGNTSPKIRRWSTPSALGVEGSA